MIAKNRKPMILEFRPIAVTPWSSKVICTFYREKIEEYLKECTFIYENQYGFTKGGRVDHCIFNLNCVANRTYESKRKEHKSLYFTFKDFKKAYDSVDRRKLIDVLIKYKVDPQIIELIVQIYAADKATINQGKLKETIEVTCDIRQGCIVSQHSFSKWLPFVL